MLYEPPTHFAASPAARASVTAYNGDASPPSPDRCHRHSSVNVYFAAPATA
jgi:hypothetical protein